MCYVTRSVFDIKIKVNMTWCNVSKLYSISIYTIHYIHAHYRHTTTTIVTASVRMHAELKWRERERKWIAKRIFADNLSLFSISDHYFGFRVIYLLFINYFQQNCQYRNTLPFISLYRRKFCCRLRFLHRRWRRPRSIFIHLIKNFWKIFFNHAFLYQSFIETHAFSTGIQLGI